MTGAATLNKIGLQTIELLSQVKTVDLPHGITNQEWPRALFAAEADRFELWAVNLGVFTSGHGSLDYRVREAESFERTLRRFMTGLNEALSEVLEYCRKDGNLPTQSEHDTTDDPTDEFEKSFDDLEDNAVQNVEEEIDLLLESVRDVINRLYKLSTRIRNPSSRTGSTKAQTYQQTDQDSGVNLFEVFESFDHDYVSSLFSQYRAQTVSRADVHGSDSASLHTEKNQAGADNVKTPIQIVLPQDNPTSSDEIECFLIRRIASSNVRRRQQFAYWRKHRNKLDQHYSAVTMPFITAKEQTLSQIQVKQQGAEVLAPTQFLTQSVTTASRLNVPQFELVDNRSTVSVSEYAPSAWQPGKEVMSFPDPPPRPLRDKYFECPYCFTLCPTNVLAPRAWK
ncbi:hypothetical protein NHQ30_006241 [Ciborinia camelliae]|nr:hypothetical protein NHQ30_006241 [Ciborinia camelliae]